MYLEKVDIKEFKKVIYKEYKSSRGDKLLWMACIFKKKMV